MRLAGVNIHADDTVLLGHPLLGGPAETIEALVYDDILEAETTENRSYQHQSRDHLNGLDGQQEVHSGAVADIDNRRASRHWRDAMGIGDAANDAVLSAGSRASATGS
jgi:hypothetical protein